MAKKKRKRESAMEDRVCKQHSGLVRAIDDVKSDTDKQWTEINRIMNRPPIWCTVVIAVLSGLLGSVLTYAALVVRITEAAQAMN